MPHTRYDDNNPSASCIGIDDGPFPPKTPNRTSHAPLVAVLLKGPHLHHIQTGWITVDGLDATDQAIRLLEKLPKAPVLLSGVTFGGFNFIDPARIQRTFRTPTIAVIGSRPDNSSVKRALVKHFDDWKARWGIIRSLGPLRQVRTMENEPPIFYESVGCTPSQARRILASNSRISRLPEPIRVAGLVARGLFTEPIE